MQRLSKTKSIIYKTYKAEPENEHDFNATLSEDAESTSPTVPLGIEPENFGELEINTEHQRALRAMQSRFRHDLEIELKLDLMNPERIKHMKEEFKLLLERQNESLDL